MVSKPTYEELEQKDQLASTPWRIYILICIVGLIITGILGYGLFTGDRMNKVYAPLVDAAMEIKLEATTAHLRLEEIISGDRHEDISVVWKHHDQAKWYAQAMLEGGKNPEGTFIPLDDTEMRRKIKNVQGRLAEFRKITQKRIEIKKASGIGNDIEQRYDHIFRSLLKEADEVETRLQQVMAKDLISFRYTHVFLIVTSILLFLVVGIAFWRFDSQRADNLLSLNEANKALQESEENLSITLNSIGDAVIATDTEGHVIRMNPVAEKLTGWSLSEAEGRHVIEVFNIINEETRKRVESPVEKVMREGIIVGLANHTLLISKDGTECPIADSGAPIRNAQGDIVGVVLVFRDVTKEREAEKTLKEYSERLEEMVEERTKDLKDAQEQLVRKEKLAMLGQLAGGVGHELRNPLGVISNAVYYLKMVLPEADETVKEYLETISSEVDRSTIIVSDLLDLSRTRSAEREQINVSELINQALDRNTPPEVIEAVTEIPSDLSPLYVDPHQIGQVLNNLIANAYQAMPGGGKLTIEVKAQEEKVNISITDTGCGISRENMEKLFEPLFTTKAHGIGLGLAVSKNLVDANEGSIEVESEEGKGSTFNVILPVKEVRS